MDGNYVNSSRHMYVTDQLAKRCELKTPHVERLVAQGRRVIKRVCSQAFRTRAKQILRWEQAQHR